MALLESGEDQGRDLWMKRFLDKGRDLCETGVEIKEWAYMWTG